MLLVVVLFIADLDDWPGLNLLYMAVELLGLVGKRLRLGFTVLADVRRSKDVVQIEPSPFSFSPELIRLRDHVQLVGDPLGLLQVLLDEPVTEDVHDLTEGVVQKLLHVFVVSENVAWSFLMLLHVKDDFFPLLLQSHKVVQDFMLLRSSGTDQGQLVLELSNSHVNKVTQSEGSLLEWFIL